MACSCAYWFNWSVRRKDGGRVSHEILQLQGPPFQVVLDSSGGSHHHIAAAPQNAFLGAIRAAAVQAHCAQVACLANVLKVCMHLQQAEANGKCRCVPLVCVRDAACVRGHHAGIQCLGFPPR